MVNKLTNFIFEKVGVNDYQKFLDLASKRHKLVSGNVANVSTPGYRAQDIDFKGELEKIGSKSSHLQGAVTHAGHIPTGHHADKSPQVTRERVGAEDINSVDIDQEVSKMAQNELLFTVGARLLQMKFEGLKNAIKSE
ncbi:MAG: flagellar basal body rod protein FlgB [bacterium]|nr:flagellar basal body rod protein FlgB [bacterium]